MALVRIAKVVSASQPWNWLTERCGILPQIHLVFDEELPQSAEGREKFVYP